MTAMRKSNVLTGFLAIAWSCAPGAWAWGGQGHRTIGAIADRLLSSPARAAVAQLLSGDLDKFGKPSGRRTLEAVSDWPDEITGTPAAHPRWHYDDAPVCGSAPKAHYCPDRQCDSEQLKRLIAVVADTRAASRDRNEALKWVVHLVGDIHQPLHAADNGDRGGNRVPVALEAVRTRGRENLHRAWDNDLVRLALRAPERRRAPADIDALAAILKSLADNLYTPDQAVELDIAELVERLRQGVGQVLFAGRPGGDQDQLLVAAVGGVGGLTGGGQQ